MIFSAVILTTGCGDGKLSTINVSGTVTFDGQPLAGATVNFSPQSSEGQPAYGVTDADGKYKLQTLLGNPDAGTTPGEYAVTISKTEKEVSTGMSEGSSKRDTSAPPPPPKSLIPERYGRADKSGLTATVGKESTVINFDLTK